MKQNIRLHKSPHQRQTAEFFQALVAVEAVAIFTHTPGMFFFSTAITTNCRIQNGKQQAHFSRVDSAICVSLMKRASMLSNQSLAAPKLSVSKPYFEGPDMPRKHSEDGLNCLQFAAKAANALKAVLFPNCLQRGAPCSEVSAEQTSAAKRIVRSATEISCEQLNNKRRHR